MIDKREKSGRSGNLGQVYVNCNREIIGNPAKRIKTGSTYENKTKFDNGQSISNW